jgi:hypothetical protein
MSQQPPSGRGGPPGDPPVPSEPPDDGADAWSNSPAGDPARSAQGDRVGVDRASRRSSGALIAVVSIVAVLVAVGIVAVLLMHRGNGSTADGPTKPVTVPISTAATLPTDTPTVPSDTPALATGTPRQSGAPSRPTGGSRAVHNAAALRAAQVFLSAAKGGRCTDAFGLADGIFKRSFQAETTCGTTVRRALTGWSASTSGAFDRFGAFGTYTFADGTTVTLHQIGGRWKVSSFLPPY